MSTEIFEYHVIDRGTAEELERRVVYEVMADGWEPLGGVAVCVHAGFPRYFQAMTRRKNLK